MIALTHLAGRKLAVFGLGGSGLVTAHALTAGGAEVVCYDDNRTRVEAAWDAGLPTGDLRVADFTAFDALVLAPGVPLTHPTPHWSVERAREAGIEVIGDVELFERERRHRLPGLRLAAITGTNGKSTTTALLGHILEGQAARVQVGGNIGRPVLDLEPEDGIAVVEVSSFQIDLAPSITPEAGALLNVTSDHLDRHGTFENYAAVKRRLVAGARVVVAGAGDRPTRTIAADLMATGKPVLGFAVDDGPRDMWVDGGDDDAPALTGPFGKGVVATREGDVYALTLIGPEGRTALGPLPAVASLRGRHNALNATAALAMVAALNLGVAAAAARLASFPGLPHRLEQVGRDGDVLFINDSKATNLDSAVTALSSFKRIHWIAGGKPKPGGVSALDAAHFDIRHAYLIGEAAEAFAATLSGKVATTVCGTLDAALAAAAAGAREGGGVVLLSPACASFDQYRSFEARGDHFRELVAQHLKMGAA